MSTYLVRNCDNSVTIYSFMYLKYCKFFVAALFMDKMVLVCVQLTTKAIYPYAIQIFAYCRKNETGFQCTKITCLQQGEIKDKN